MEFSNTPHTSLRRRTFVLLLFWTFAALSRSLFGADAATGVVTGQVFNEATGDALSAAVITLEGSEGRISAITGTDGTFRIVVPEGASTLIATFPGLDDTRASVVVSAGQTLKQDIMMNSSIYELEAFVVKGLREGQAAAIQEERQAANIRTVAAVDAFGNPASSVGELLQRLPGVAVDGASGSVGSINLRGMEQDFISLLVNGNQIATSGGTSLTSTNVYFGQVNTGALASLEIIKAQTPDMDGNAIAGYVNLRTKRAFERKPGRTIKASGATSWIREYRSSTVPIKDSRKLDMLNLEYSEVFSVFGGTNNLGVVGTLTRDMGTGIITEYGPRQALNYAYTSYYVPAVTEGNDPQMLIAGWGGGEWGTIGKLSPGYNMSLSADFKANDNTTVYFKGTLSLYDLDEGSFPSYFRWKLASGRKQVNFETDSTYDVVHGKNGVLTLESSLYSRESTTRAFSGGLEQKLFDGTGKLVIDANYSKAETVYPGICTAKATLSGISWTLDRRGRDAFLPSVTQTGGKDWSDPANYALTTTTNNAVYKAPAKRSGIKADFQKDFQTALPLSIKMGLKQSHFEQTVDRQIYYYIWQGGDGTVATGGTTPYVAYNMSFNEGEYGPFPFLQVPRTGLPGDVFADPTDWTQDALRAFSTAYNSKLYDSSFEETINAAYLQGNITFGRCRVLGGLRVEQTSTEGGKWSRIQTQVTSGNASLSVDENIANALANFGEWETAGTRYTDLFPGLHFVYEAPKDIQVRASFTTSITRPSASMLTPNTYINQTAQQLTVGNPDLQPYTSSNFDFSVEKYLSGVGKISIGVFWKEIRDYYRQFSVSLDESSIYGDEFDGWALLQYRNTGKARIRGIEFSWNQQFTFLPGVFRGLGAYANYTYLDTWGDFGSEIATDKLPEMTPHTANAGITFRAKGFDIRLMANYRGEFYRATQTGTYGADTYVYATGNTTYEIYQHERLLVDIKAQYKINRYAAVFFDAYNITNEYSTTDYVRKLGYEDPSYAKKFGTNFKLGVNLTFD